MKKLFTSLVFTTTVFFAGNAQCDPPVNLASSYSNNVSAFTWNAVPGAVSYKFQLKFQWDPWDYPYEVVLTTNSFSLTGLFQSAPLEWRVSANCGGPESAFSAVQSYATPCPQPSGLTTTNITGTSATLNWIAAPGYNTTVSDFVVSYRLANTNNAWTSLGHTSALSKNVTGLSSNTSYEWKVSQSCMYSTSNPVTSQFTTMYIACNIPANLAVTNISGTQATVSWSGVTGGLTYSVEYKPVNSTTWSTPVNTTSASVVLSGLTQSTLYDCRVKANCSGGSSGYISRQFTTYTSVCTSYGTNSNEWIDYFSLGSIARTSGAEIGGYFNTGLSTNLLKGSSNNSITISAGYNPGVVFGEYYAVYIDFNRNGSFADAGERVVAPAYINNGGNFSSTFSVPNNISTGPAKMRVILRRSGSTISPCATGFKGETEDYDVNIVAGSLRASYNPAGADEAIPAPVVMIAPNPSPGLFTIMLPQRTNTIIYEVAGPAGIVVRKGNIKNEKTFIIDISSMPDGLYILKTVDQNGIQTVQKLIKTK